MRWAIYCWPGLPQLWLRGLWSGLGLAAVAAAGLNVAILAGFAWSEWIAADVRNGLWMALAVLWIASAGLSARWIRRQPPPKRTEQNADAAKDDFSVALEHYLKGNYFETERLLQRLLQRNARDLEARLMLATLLRHTGRRDEALVHLDLLDRFEGSQKWELEIRQERDLLADAKTATDEPVDPPREPLAEQRSADTKDAA